MPHAAEVNSNTKKQAMVSELNAAFVDVKPSKRAADKGAAIPQPKDIDIRKWPISHRSALKGDHIYVTIGDRCVASMSKPLLKVASTKFDDLYKNSVLQLPADTEELGLHHLFGYLEYVARSRKAPAVMSRNITLDLALGVTAAAATLGADKYTAHIYKMCEAILREDIFKSVNIQTITAYRKEHYRLYRIVVNILAIAVWDGTVQDKEEFAKTLKACPAIEAAIHKANKDYARSLH